MFGKLIKVKKKKLQVLIHLFYQTGNLSLINLLFVLPISQKCSFEVPAQSRNNLIVFWAGSMKKVGSGPGRDGSKTPGCAISDLYMIIILTRKSLKTMFHVHQVPSL